MRRVPALGAAPGDCALLSLAGTASPLMMKAASSHDDSLCMLSSLIFVVAG
jgi:hypothetical protein